VNRRRIQPLQWFRHGVQTAIAAYVLVIVIANTVGETWASNLHTICPLGGVVNLYTYLSGGGYVAKLHSAVFIMLLALIIGLVLTGKSFCGWICPLGAVQEGLGGIGRRLWPRAYDRVPRWLERVLHYLKWAVLAWVLVQTARTSLLVFQDWDPYYNLFRIWTDEVAISGYAVTGVTLLLSLFIPRPFSRFACPLGAFNGLFNSFAFIGITRDATTCTECGRCTRVCPVNIDLCATKTVWSVECMRCLKCIDACLVNSRAPNTLRLHTWVGRFTRPRDAAPGTTQRRRPVSTWIFAAIAIAAFVVPILVTNLTGDFQITGGRGGGGGGGGGGGRGESQESVEPATSTENESDAQESGSSSTIRGSTTLGDIQAMGADIAVFMEEFGIPADTPPTTRLRDLTELYGFEISEARAFLQ
jgi:polyferredoxin